MLASAGSLCTDPAEVIQVLKSGRHPSDPNCNCKTFTEPLYKSHKQNTRGNDFGLGDFGIGKVCLHRSSSRQHGQAVKVWNLVGIGLQVW